jgi:transketolase
MRNALCQSLIAHAKDDDFVFLTGDLGFMALEPLRDAAGDRFINAGVAEQNMVSVAAGLARTGLKPWAYSIAPFIYARPYEQIRNDISSHDLPVTLCGNGGGYGYGVMGETHHALGDYGALLCLRNMHVFVPAFAADVPILVDHLSRFRHPAYLRLGRCEKNADAVLPPYSSWRCLLDGQGDVVVVVGPLVGGIWNAVLGLGVSEQPSLWVVTELPITLDAIPPTFLERLKRSERLLVVEEHVAQGSAGQMLAHALAVAGKMPRHFVHRCAQGYPSERYGSQAFHRKESGIDPESIVAELTK